MPIDVGRVAGAELPVLETSWTANDVILYQLGLGLGTDPADERELQYVYEGQLKVVPSYGVIAPFPQLWRMLKLEGMDVDLASILHGEQELEIHRPLPTQADVRVRARITDVVDKGQAALVVLETVTETTGGEPLCTNRFSAFVKGEGGFGNGSAAKGSAPPPVIPDRAPDHEVACVTLPHQTLIYRLSGDDNPLHADPAFARRAGFDKPILHGLCSFGVACHAVVDTVLDGAVERVAAYRGRFAGVAYPGETLIVRMWEQEDAVLLEVVTLERESPVLKSAAIALR